MSELADGHYDVIVVDVETFDDDTVRIDLALVRGDARGDVISIRGARTARDPIDFLALPGVLTVEDGRPSFIPESGV